MINMFSIQVQVKLGLSFGGVRWQNFLRFMGLDRKLDTPFNSCTTLWNGESYPSNGRYAGVFLIISWAWKMFAHRLCHIQF